METLQQLLDHNAIIDTINNIGNYADQHQWDKLYACFADKVELDYTSMNGGEAQEMTPAQIISLWQEFLPGFNMTQHMITNHRVTLQENEAESFSYVFAFHYLSCDFQSESCDTLASDDSWLVIGHYDHHLIKTPKGWRVDKMKFTLKHMSGNIELPVLAQERVKSGL